MGGLLFGYDWVVIGGAKPFYEVYFHLTSRSLIGWANSCALLGCFAGSLARRTLRPTVWPQETLIISALLFALSSIFTGWAYSFTCVHFLADHRRRGHRTGVERLADVHRRNQPGANGADGWSASTNSRIVIGILAAQIVNWRIAENDSSRSAPNRCSQHRGMYSTAGAGCSPP